MPQPKAAAPETTPGQVKDKGPNSSAHAEGGVSQESFMGGGLHPDLVSCTYLLYFLESHNLSAYVLLTVNWKV